MIETFSIDDRVAAVFANGPVERAFQTLQSSESTIEADQIRITMVPAPPFHEDARAASFSSELRAAGFEPVFDTIGNVTALYDAPGPNPVIVGAHLDTV